MAPGDRLHDTYVAALQHDLVALPDGTTLVGVVRKPTHWFAGAVDENHPALGPPAALLDEFQERHEDRKRQGLCDEGAHNAVWEDLDFAGRYRDHLRDDPDAQAAVDALLDRLRDGERLALVCYENTDQKRCHRTILDSHLRERLAAESEGGHERTGG